MIENPIYGNNGLEEMSDAQLEYYSHMPIIPLPPKSDAERIAELEAQLAALTAGYKEGVQNA